MQRPRVGFIVPFVPFYEGIVPLREEKRALAADLARRLARSCDVHDAGLVESEAAARDAGERFAADRLDAVVVAPALAAFGALGWAALEAVPRTPVALWHVPLADTVPDGYEITALIRHSAGLSVMAIGNTLARYGRAFRVFHGPPAGASGVPDGLDDFCRTARVAALIRTGTFLRMGSVFPAMTDVMLDAGEWHRSTGGRVVEMGPEDVHERFARVEAHRVEARVKSCARLGRVALSDDEMARSVRLALAIQDAAAEHDAVGGAFNCHGINCLQHPAIGVTGCLGVSWMAGAGRPFSCTGDLPTAVALVIAKELSGTAIYGELDLVDARRNRVLLANGGEHDVGASEEGYGLFGNENFVGLAGRGASVAAAAFNGPATLVSFTPLESTGRAGRYRVIVAEGHLCDDRRPALRGFHAAFQFAGMDAADGFVHWCEAGATHHLALASGHQANAVRLLADFCGWEAAVVDSNGGGA